MLYIMVRAKKGMSDLQRLEEIFKSEIFNAYFTLHPEMRTLWNLKVKPLTGDLEKEGLAFSDESKQIMLT